MSVGAESFFEVAKFSILEGFELCDFVVQLPPFSVQRVDDVGLGVAGMFGRR